MCLKLAMCLSIHIVDDTVETSLTIVTCISSSCLFCVLFLLGPIRSIVLFDVSVFVQSHRGFGTGKAKLRVTIRSLSPEY